LNSIRFFLACLVRVLLLVALLAAACFAPLVQTWVARREIFRQPGVSGSLGYLTARFGRLEIQDLHLDDHGILLTLPSLEATLPLTAAALHRQVLVQTVVAKGWTLDLSHSAGPAAAPADAGTPAGTGGEAEPAAEEEASPARRAAAFFDGLLREWQLPCDLSLDNVDLEGDVVVPAVAQRMTYRVHVTITGGGMAAGHEGSFAITAVVNDPRLPVNTVSAQGRLAVAMGSPRTVSRLELKADLSAQGGSLTRTLSLSTDIAAARGAGEETYTLDLIQAGRHLATFLVRYPAATHRLEGSWKIDLKDTDLKPFLLDHPLPTFSATGEGRLEADTAFARVHAAGNLSAAASRLEVLAPPLERLGSVTLEARFDLAGSGTSVRVDHLNLSLIGGRLAASVQALQAFDFDGKTRELKAADPNADWLGISFRGFPLAWLSDPTSRFTFAGDAAGELIGRAAHGGFAVRAKTPLTATGVSLQGADRALAGGITLSVPLQADYNPQGWQFRCAPVVFSRGGRQLGTIEAQASTTAGADQPIAVTGTWKADLAALAETAAGSEKGVLAGRSASGDFSAKFGSATEFEAKVALVGRDPTHSLTASVGGELDVMGGISFVAPVKIVVGPETSEMSAEGSWSGPGPDSRLDFKLTSESVALDHLRLLAGPLAAAGNALLPAQNSLTPAGAARRIPFWGGWVGRVTVAFDHVRSPERTYDDVGGAFEIDPVSIKLEGGRAALPRKRELTGSGTLSFDPAAALPYSIKATAGVDQIEAGTFFGTPPHGQDPTLEGKFAIAGTFTGTGRDLPDLRGRLQEEFRLTGTNGILRMLATNVAEVIPQADTPVKDAVGSVGHAVENFLEIKRTANSDKNPVSKSAEAVLDFTTEVAEVGYDQLKLTARRDSDGNLHLSDIALTGPDARLTGSGRIDYVPGRALRARPLSLDLQYGTRDQIAELLARAGLLSGHKDDLGYSMLNQTVHFGGTLERIDSKAWHDLLAKAATREPPPKK